MSSQLSSIYQSINFKFRRKVPQIIQTEAAECGLACIAMVTAYYGMRIDLFNLHQRFDISSRGATLNHLIHIASALKLKTRALAANLDEIIELRRPAILHWDFNHFVVLVAIKGSRYVIHDPAIGRRVYTLDEISKHYTGVALELWPDVEFKPIKLKTRLNFFSMINNIHGLKGALTKLFFLSVVIEAINLLMPVGTQLVMDHVIIAEDKSLLTVICLGLLFFIIFKAFVSMGRAWITIVMGTLINIQWTIGLFDHMLKLPLSYFEKRQLGDIQSRYISLDTVRSTLTTNIVNSLIDGVMIVGIIIMLILYGGWLFWVVLGFTLIYIALRLATYSWYRIASEEKIVKDAKSSSYFMETLYGISTLKALGLAQVRSKNQLNLNVDAANAGIRITKFDMMFGGLNTLISAIDQVVILWLGASAVIDSELTLGMFVAFNAYRGQFSDRAANLINMALQLIILRLHNERISDVALSAAEPELPSRQIMPPNEAASIEAKGIYFQYDSLSKPIIANLNLRIEAGECVAIVGPSGVGKTTLMKIMAGLLIPTKGEILVNGMDIKIVGTNNYRQCIACVLQEDKLFAGTISDNISSFEAEVDYDYLQTCARYANIHDDIMKMPMGYETLISELGASLSGGQKQRLLIARALYRRPNILFMDEATSHLDSGNETAINNAISMLNMTRIIIAHRPSTIAAADRVISLLDYQQ